MLSMVKIVKKEILQELRTEYDNISESDFLKLTPDVNQFLGKRLNIIRK